MELNEGTLFLLRRARRLASETSLDQIEKEERSAAEAIVLAMDFLPLALDQAGICINAASVNYPLRWQKRLLDSPVLNLKILDSIFRVL
jgi:hypothetical protein